MNALYMEIRLEQILISLNTVEFTMQQSLMHAVNVGNLFHLGPDSVIIRVL